MSHSSSRVSLASAYILHQRPYRDTSLLLEIFSCEYGRVGLVARGVRGRKKGDAALLQPFIPLLMSWSGRGDLATMTGVEANGPARQLQGQALLSGFYVNELLTRLIHRHDPYAELFGYYNNLVGLLSELDDGPDGRSRLQELLRLFEKKLLLELGYGLVLEYEIDNGAAIQAQGLYRYVLGKGPVLVENQTGKEKDLLISGASLLSFADGCLHDATSLRDAKRLTRLVLDHYLGGQPLRSRQLLIDLQRTVDAASLAKSS